MTGGDQIELGTVTLAALGKKIGDTVRIGAPPFTRTVVITGTVTLPSFGIGAAEHVSLGRGAMVPEATLLAAMGAGKPKRQGGQSMPVFPSAVAIDWAPGSQPGATSGADPPGHRGQPGRDARRHLRAA